MLSRTGPDSRRGWAPASSAATASQAAAMPLRLSRMVSSRSRSSTRSGLPSGSVGIGEILASWAAGGRSGTLRSVSETLPHLFLVRLSGDVGTKARWTHGRFVRRLRANLRDALESQGIPARVQGTRDRIFARAASPAAGPVLARVFGVQSVSPAHHRPAAGVEDVVALGEPLFREAVRGRRFAVRARRVGDRSRVPVDAREVERALGAALLPVSAGVDLDHPEVTAFVELMADGAYFFGERLDAPGGLPLGVEGRALALVSGGFDSAVAAWLLQKRGVALDHLFCNLGGEAHQLGVLRVMKVLADDWSYGTRPRLHAVDFDAVTRDLRARCEPRFWQVILKRLMLRAAERVADETGAEALATGEALGQVSSQTLTNLATIGRAAQRPVLRPLVGFNKEEIVAAAGRIGTYEISATVAEYCAMVPSKPATGAGLAAVEAQERALDPELLERAVAQRAVFDLRALDVEKIGIPELEVDAVPEDATVIDLRSKAAYRSWHWPGALFLDFPHALAGYPKFDRDRTYVLYCELGLKSAHLAELMRREGLRAWNFRGGLRGLLRHARERGVDTPEPVGEVGR